MVLPRRSYLHALQQGPPEDFQPTQSLDYETSTSPCPASAPSFSVAGRGNPNADLASSSGRDGDYGWCSPDEATSMPFSRDPQEVLELASRWDLCVVGDALRHIAATGSEALFIPLIQVRLTDFDAGLR